MGKYVSYPGEPYEPIDATKFVLSGEFYFNCERGYLLRKTPPPFPIEVLEQTQDPKIRNITPKYDKLVADYTTNPDWHLGFQYLYSGISTFNHSVIGDDIFYKVIGLGDNRIIFKIFYSHVKIRGAKTQFSILVDKFNPQIHLTRDQIIEACKQSCPHPQ